MAPLDGTTQRHAKIQPFPSPRPAVCGSRARDCSRSSGNNTGGHGDHSCLSRHSVVGRLEEGQQRQRRAVPIKAIRNLPR